MGEGEGWDVVHDVTRRSEETAANEGRKGREGKGKGGPVQVEVGPSRFPRQTNQCMQCKEPKREKKRFGKKEVEHWDQLGGRRAYFDQGCRITE